MQNTKDINEIDWGTESLTVNCFQTLARARDLAFKGCVKQCPRGVLWPPRAALVWILTYAKNQEVSDEKYKRNPGGILDKLRDVPK
jgi:hypothetical protein